MLRFVLLAAVVAAASAQALPTPNPSICTTYGDGCKCYTSKTIKVTGGVCDGDSFVTSACANDQTTIDNYATANGVTAGLFTQAVFDSAIVPSQNLMCIAIGGADSKSTMTSADMCKDLKSRQDISCEDSLCAKVTATSTIPVCCKTCENNLGKYCSKTDSKLLETYCSTAGCKTDDCYSAASSIVPSMTLLAVAAIAAMFF